MQFRKEENPLKLKFENGLRFVFVPVQEDFFSLLVLVGVGSAYETKENSGISHFLEHMTFKGTKKRPKPLQIALELDEIGASYNAFTSYEYTGYWVKARKKHFLEVLDLLSDIYLNSTFPEEEIKKERGVILEELRMYKDNPASYVSDLFMNLFYGDQPLGWPIIGFKKNIQRFRQQDFLLFKEKFYLPTNTIVILAGQPDLLSFKGEIKNKFSFSKPVLKVKKKKNYSPTSFKKKAVFREIEQVQFVLGFPLFSIFDKRRYIAELVSTILSKGMSSRLWTVLREEYGLVYTFSSSVDLFTDTGFFSVSAGLDKSRYLQGIKAILEELKRLKKDKISQNELRKVKEIYISSLLFSLETLNQKAFFYGVEELIYNKVISPKEIIKEVEKVDSDQIFNFSKKFIRSDKIRMVTLGPKKKLPSISEVRKILD